MMWMVTKACKVTFAKIKKGGNYRPPLLLTYGGQHIQFT